MKIHTWLSFNDLRKLYSSEGLSVSSTGVFQVRPVFIFGLAPTIRQTALHTIKMQQVQPNTLRNENFMKSRTAIGSQIEASKKEEGLLHVKDISVKFFIWNITQFNGLITIYKYISTYLNVRESLVCPTDRFFWILM